MPSHPWWLFLWMDELLSKYHSTWYLSVTRCPQVSAADLGPPSIRDFLAFIPLPNIVSYSVLCEHGFSIHRSWKNKTWCWHVDYQVATGRSSRICLFICDVTDAASCLVVHHFFPPRHCIWCCTHSCDLYYMHFLFCQKKFLLKRLSLRWTSKRKGFIIASFISKCPAAWWSVSLLSDSEEACHLFIRVDSTLSLSQYRFLRMLVYLCFWIVFVPGKEMWREIVQFGCVCQNSYLHNTRWYLCVKTVI